MHEKPALANTPPTGHYTGRCIVPDFQEQEGGTAFRAAVNVLEGKILMVMAGVVGLRPFDGLARIGQPVNVGSDQ